jgi:hypothetical protein
MAETRLPFPKKLLQMAFLHRILSDVFIAGVKVKHPSPSSLRCNTFLFVPSIAGLSFIGRYGHPVGEENPCSKKGLYSFTALRYKSVRSIRLGCMIFTDESQYKSFTAENQTSKDFCGLKALRKTIPSVRRCRLYKSGNNLLTLALAEH